MFEEILSLGAVYSIEIFTLQNQLAIRTHLQAVLCLEGRFQELEAEMMLETAWKT